MIRFRAERTQFEAKCGMGSTSAPPGVWGNSDSSADNEKSSDAWPSRSKYAGATLPMNAPEQVGAPAKEGTMGSGSKPIRVASSRSPSASGAETIHAYMSPGSNIGPPSGVGSLGSLAEPMSMEKNGSTAPAHASPPPGGGASTLIASLISYLKPQYSMSRSW